jgi:outer membrane protein assembly factor BamD (BamD/ComL family)
MTLAGAESPGEPMTLLGQARASERSDEERDRQDREKEREQRERERESRLYDQGRDDIDQGRYDRAIERFGEVVSMKGTRADAALYYRAWAQNKAGQRAEALNTIAALARDYP